VTGGGQVMKIGPVRRGHPDGGSNDYGLTASGLELKTLMRPDNIARPGVHPDIFRIDGAEPILLSPRILGPLVGPGGSTGVKPSVGSAEEVDSGEPGVVDTMLVDIDLGCVEPRRCLLRLVVADQQILARAVVPVDTRQPPHGNVRHP